MDRFEGKEGEGHTLTLLLPRWCYVGEFAACEFEECGFCVCVVWIWGVELHAAFGVGVDVLEDCEGYVLFFWGEGDCVGGRCACWGGVAGCVCVGHVGDGE